MIYPPARLDRTASATFVNRRIVLDTSDGNWEITGRFEKEIMVYKEPKRPKK
jgi:hypothetical protein